MASTSNSSYIRLILLGIVVCLSAFLWTSPLPFAQGLMLILGVLTLLWGVSIAIKDASIVDIFWGLGFVLLAWFYFYLTNNQSLRAKVLVGLVTLWGVRLALHLAFRNLGKGEDYRYQVWRKEHGNNFWWVSFFRVFVLQGVLLWLIAVPLLVAQTYVGNLTFWDGLGVLLWLVGFGFEAVGDWQLRRFKQNPANQGKVLDTGLWRYTRHPNYFGDAVLWWGYYCFAVSAGGWWAFFAPLLMTFLLMQVSGVALLEKTLVTTKPQYRRYMQITSAFFPRPPRNTGEEE
jgi:steroid 5-alpha reductase family enzyme